MMNGDGTNPNKEVAREGGGIMQLSRRAKRRCRDVAERERESEAKKCAPPSLCSAFLQDKASGADAAPVENTVSNVA